MDETFPYPLCGNLVRSYALFNRIIYFLLPLGAHLRFSTGGLHNSPSFRYLVLPVGMCCFIQGIIYGLFTKLGFFRHGWLVAKWILSILTGICVGIGGVSALREVLDAAAANPGATTTWLDGAYYFLFLFLQLAMLLSINIISIWKPKQKRNIPN